MLVSVMRDQLATARKIVADGHEVVPAWRVITGSGHYLVLTRFNHDDEKQRARLLHLMRRFMAWKLARAFVVTGETELAGPLAGNQAIFAVGVSRDGSAGLFQMFTRRNDGVEFDGVQELSADGIDEAYLSLLPGRVETISVEEAAELQAAFGPAGEMPAERL